VNRPIVRLFGFVALLFALLVAFTSRWTVFEADALRKNPLNQRELLETLKIPRGVIRAADGTVLARSRPVGSGELRTYTRVYPPAANPFAHALGYSFARTAQAGLERERNDELTGKNSEVGTIVDQLTGKKQVGNDLYTTLDPKAQQAALNGLAGRKGAVVALDPRTGAIKAMASFPGYAPEALRSAAKKRALDTDAAGSPLFNRATQSAYAPGSTFKVVTAIAALDSGRFTPSSSLSGKSPKKISPHANITVNCRTATIERYASLPRRSRVIVTRVERMRSSVPLSASSMSAPPAPVAEKRRNITPRPEARSAEVAFFFDSPRTSLTSTATSPASASDPAAAPRLSEERRRLRTFSSSRARCSAVSCPPHRST